MPHGLKRFLAGPFSSENRISKTVLSLFLLINGIVLFNAICHDPRIGYDAYGHLEYIQVLSEFRLPSPLDTREFFSPPLPYLVPSIAYRLASRIFSQDRIRLGVAAKTAQLLNVLFSIGLIFYVLKLCGVIRPNSDLVKKITLLLILGLTVYYKTFSFVRGEPLVAFLYVYIVYKTIVAFGQQKINPSSIISIGVSIGLLILSRQWGFFIFPAIGLYGMIWWVQKKNGFFMVKFLSATFVIALLVGGWFYAHLDMQQGGADAFNREGSQSFKLTNQPPEFYFGLSLGKLFSDPVRKSFPNQFLPIFYSETWGDYWCFFDVYGVDVRDGKFVPGEHLEAETTEKNPPAWLKTNRYGISGFLGMVNLFSLLGSSIMFAGVLLGLLDFGKCISKRSVETKVIANAFLFLIVAVSFVGYFWFLIMYPNLGKGDTIKASYILHIFPFVSIMAAQVVEYIRGKSKYSYYVVMAFLVISWVHNFPAFVTHYIFFPIS